jgi:putative ABC transport system permease protein
MPLRIDVFEGSSIAVRSLMAHKLRTLLTIVGIGIGVATLLAILGIIQGIDTSFEKQLEGLGTKTLTVSKWPGGFTTDWWVYRNRKNFDSQQANAIKEKCTRCSVVVLDDEDNADVSFLGKTMTAVAIEGSSDGFLEAANYELQTGRFLTQSDEDNRQPVAVLGADVAQTLFRDVSPLGSSIRIDSHPYTVIGTLRAKGKIADQSFDYRVIIPYSRYRTLNPARVSPNVMVMGKPGTTLDELEGELVPILRAARQTPPEKPDDFSFQKAEQAAEQYKKLTQALYAVALGIGFITLLVGGIGVMNIMLVSVRERTREIGVRRALGARKSTIVWQFVLEAVAVSAVGGAIGTATGLSLAKIVSMVSPLAATVKVSTIVFGVSFSALVGLVFGLWPAVRAASLDPVEALRNE